MAFDEASVPFFPSLYAHDGGVAVFNAFRLIGPGQRGGYADDYRFAGGNDDGRLGIGSQGSVRQVVRRFLLSAAGGRNQGQGQDRQGAKGDSPESGAGEQWKHR